MQDITYKCPNCGAKVYSEICDYCGTKVNIKEQDVTTEYPTVKADNVKPSFLSMGFALIFGATFGYAGVIVPITMHQEIVESGAPIVLFLPFALVGIGAMAVLIRYLYGYVATLLFGKIYTAKVYAYLDDTIAYNNVPGVVMKVLVDTIHGKRFLLISMKGTERPYPINSKIDIKVYKSSVLIKSKFYLE
ncbi:MAG: zinc ribbon domain-containing protein [Lachnospiraceae bacterium]|nr:zinc ribbon domain-containing protein [Lachnospiraceae bacterium]